MLYALSVDLQEQWTPSECMTLAVSCSDPTYPSRPTVWKCPPSITIPQFVRFVDDSATIHQFMYQGHQLPRTGNLRAELLAIRALPVGSYSCEAV